MKQFRFVHILTMLSLVVVLASCGLAQPGYGEDYSDRPVRNRQVYMDPYYGNSTIVRDPYTGRYYEVMPVDPYGYGGFSAPYGSYGNSGYYGRNNTRVYSNNTRVNNNRENNTNTPRRTQTPQVQQQQPRESSPTINKAKSIIRKD
jgi:hypothetical protein